jgi:hypothetical protein
MGGHKLAKSRKAFAVHAFKIGSLPAKAGLTEMGAGFNFLYYLFGSLVITLKSI